MKVIDAVWEKRNLGIDCKEISIEEDDNTSCADAVAALSAQTDYTVVKVPVNKFEIFLALQNEGFSVIETAIDVTCDLNKVKVNPYYDRFLKQMSYEKAAPEDAAFLEKELRNGLFDTDRVYLDPYFTKEQASNRYVNWIKDEMSRTTELFIIKYKENKIGFFTFKEIDCGVYYPFLAGLFKDYKESGLGFSVIYCPIMEAQKRGGKKIRTSVSSNNHSIVKIHVLIGFQIEKMSYTLVKHTRNSAAYD